MTKLYDLKEMEKRLAAIDAERDPLVKMIEAVKAYEGQVGQTVHATEKVTIRQRPKPTGIGTGKAPTVLDITAGIAIEEMEATGAPVPTRKVLEIMEARGLPLPNRNHINVVSARLSNSDKLQGRRGFGWWYKDRPWPGDSALPEMFDPADEADLGGGGEV